MWVVTYPISQRFLVICCNLCEIVPLRFPHLDTKQTNKQNLILARFIL